VATGRTLELVVNPAAGGGRAGRVLKEFSQALGAEGFDVTVHRATGKAHLAETVQSLVEQRAPWVAVMGGDGTFHDAMNALLRADGTVMPTPETAFALVPAGTGSDLAVRGLGIPPGAPELARWLAAATPKPFDLGLLEFLDRRRVRAKMLFTNIASCGISGRVDELVGAGPRWLTGKASYLVATGRAIAGWRHRPMRVRVDGEVVYEGKAMTIAVCNGRAFGGGMIMAPHADSSDGLFEVIGLGDMGLGDVLQNFPKIYKGTHLGAPKVVSAQGKVIEIESTDDDVPLDIDGEPPGTLPASFTALPGAVRVLRAP
jgi:diacylglycerol kinase (ATP)